MATRWRSLILTLLTAAIVGASLAWIIYRVNHRRAFVDYGPLAPPPSGHVQFAGAQPKNPFHLEEGNVLARTVFTAPGPSNSQIEVRDYRFPPHVRSRLAGLPGAAIIEVYFGTGTASWGGKSEEVSDGYVRSVAVGQPLEFDNRGDYSLVVRIYLIEGK